jgi:hypothetical protein
MNPAIRALSRIVALHLRIWKRAQAARDAVSDDELDRLELDYREAEYRLAKEQGNATA